MASVQSVDTDDSQSPQNPSVMPMNKIKSDRPAKQIDKQEAALRVKRDFRLRLVVAFHRHKVVNHKLRTAFGTAFGEEIFDESR